MPLLSASEESLRQAAAVIRQGGLVAFPTETVYGLGADALNAYAVAKIFAAKGRPAFDPLIVHVASAQDVERVARDGHPRMQELARQFWPGPLTLVLPKHPDVPDIVTAGLPTVAVRVPDHPVARALIEQAGTPIAAPSANPFGYVSPTTAAHVQEQLGNKTDVILDGGPCRIGLESTVISLVTDPPVILRYGGLTPEMLEPLLGPLAKAESPGDRPNAPGQLSRHYATHTPLTLLSHTAETCLRTGKLQLQPNQKVGLLAFKAPENPQLYAAVAVLAPDGDLLAAAARLFATLRRLDSMGLDHLLAEPVPEQGIGLAIMDRLRRAARFHL